MQKFNDDHAPSELTSERYQNLGDHQPHSNINETAAGTSKTNGISANTTGANFRADGAIQPLLDAKAIATLIAQLALAGHAVHRAQSDGFIVTKWGQTRYCANFAELAAFARQLGVNHD